MTYESPNVYTIGDVIPNLSPVVSGGTVTSFSISPALPAGLSFDTATGIISGTPSALSGTILYTVTAFNSGGSTSFELAITVNEIAPSTLTYPSPNVFLIGEVVSLAPVYTGNVSSFSIQPSLPDGLILNNLSGEISGSPTTITPTTFYIVTAENSGGSTTFTIELTIDEFLSNPENHFDNVRVFPNPFVDVIHVIGNLGNAAYRIYSVDGKFIQKGTLSNTEININHVPSGLYFLEIKEKNTEKTFKILKK